MQNVGPAYHLGAPWCPHKASRWDVLPGLITNFITTFLPTSWMLYQCHQELKGDGLPHASTAAVQVSRAQHHGRAKADLRPDSLISRSSSPSFCSPSPCMSDTLVPWSSMWPLTGVTPVSLCLPCTGETGCCRRKGTVFWLKTWTAILYTEIKYYLSAQCAQKILALTSLCFTILAKKQT